MYPGVFPNLAGLVKSKKPRTDLKAVLMTGLRSGVIPDFTNFTGAVAADMLRLNAAIASRTWPSRSMATTTQRPEASRLGRPPFHSGMSVASLTSHG